VSPVVNRLRLRNHSRNFVNGPAKNESIHEPAQPAGQFFGGELNVDDTTMARVQRR